MTFRPEFRKKQFPNGLTLVMERHPGVVAQTLAVFVKVGSAHEKVSQNGLSHFLEHMLFKGTTTRTPVQISGEIESCGGDLNAYTEKEFTCYHATVLKKDISKAFDVISDMLFRPTFPSEEVEREKKVLLQEMAMLEETPEDWVTTLLFGAVWKGQPLGLPILGSRKAMKSLSRRSLVSFYKKHYRPENMVVSVAGDFSFEELEELTARYFGMEDSKGNKSQGVKGSRYHSVRKSYVMDAEQLHLMFAFEGVEHSDPLRIPHWLLSYYFAGGMSSRLFQEIREKHGLAYSVESDAIQYAGSGLLTIYVGLEPKALKRCLGILKKEIERITTESLSEDELNRVKGQLTGAIELACDSMESRAESIARAEMIFGKYVSAAELIESIDSVTPEAIRTAAQEVFSKKKESVISLGKTKYKPSELSIFS